MSCETSLSELFIILTQHVAERLIPNNMRSTVILFCVPRRVHVVTCSEHCRLWCNDDRGTWWWRQGAQCLYFHLKEFFLWWAQLWRSGTKCLPLWIINVGVSHTVKGSRYRRNEYLETLQAVEQSNKEWDKKHVRVWMKDDDDDELKWWSVSCSFKRGTWKLNKAVHDAMC